MPKNDDHRLSDRHKVLTGKRKNPRRRKALTVKLMVPSGLRFVARTADVSRGGMLAEVTDPQFLPSGDRGDLFPFAARVASVFPNGMSVLFGDGAVQVHADIVRLVARPGISSLLLGCRFTPNLTDFDCRLLGVEIGGDETDSFGAEMGESAACAPDPQSCPPADVLQRVAVKARGAASPPPAPSRVEGPTSPDPAPSPTARVRLWKPSEEVGSGVPDVPAPAEDPSVASVLDPASASAPAAPASLRAPRLTTAEVATKGVVVAHLWPSGGPLFGPRYLARVVDVDVEERRVVMDLSLPDDERDPVAFAAGLGAFARAVLMLDGRVLWEARFAIDRLAEGPDPAWARVEAEASSAPPPLARAAFEHAFARA